jgi:hypothetical protein
MDSMNNGMIDAGQINPATGLPMMGGVDIMGNPWGADLSPAHHWHDDHASSISHDAGSVGSDVYDYSSPSFGHDYHHHHHQD